MKKVVVCILALLLILNLSVNTFAYEKGNEESSPYYNEYIDFVENGREYIINGELVTINILDIADRNKLEEDKENILKNGFEEFDNNIFDIANQLQDSVKNGEKEFEIEFDYNPLLRSGFTTGYKTISRYAVIKVGNTNQIVYYQLEFGLTVNVGKDEKISDIIKTSIYAYDFKDSSGLNYGRFNGGSASAQIVANNCVKVTARYTIGVPLAGAYWLESGTTTDAYTFLYHMGRLD